MSFVSFTADSFTHCCDLLAAKDPDLHRVIRDYGYPPMWSRPNTFESLVHIILEQQVSLASALSALNKLRERVQEVTPATLLALTDDELRACYFSRQKTEYSRQLALAISRGEVDLHAFREQGDAAIRSSLVSLKGIGNWTVDVYLMFVLQRADVFPIGDLAAVNALKRVKNLPKDTTRETLVKIVEDWAPYRTVATMLLWHFYLSAGRKSG